MYNYDISIRPTFSMYVGVSVESSFVSWLLYLSCAYPATEWVSCVAHVIGGPVSCCSICLQPNRYLMTLSHDIYFAAFRRAQHIC